MRDRPVSLLSFPRIARDGPFYFKFPGRFHTFFVSRPFFSFTATHYLVFPMKQISSRSNAILNCIELASIGAELDILSRGGGRASSQWRPSDADPFPRPHTSLSIYYARACRVL